MKDSKVYFPILAAGLLALACGASRLIAQTVVLPPVAPPVEEASPDAPAPTEVPADSIPSDAVAPAPVEGTDPAAEPADTEPEAGEGDAPAPAEAESPARAGNSADEDEAGDEEKPELVPLPIRPTNKEEDTFLPVSYSPERYAPTWANSAFTREIVPEAVDPVVVINELDKYVLTGLATIGGSTVVSSLSPKNEPVIIRTEPKDKGGLFVVSVDRADRMADSSVVISDGRQTGTIKFDSKRIMAPPKGAVAVNTGNVQRGPGGIGAGAVGGQQLTPQQQQQQQQLMLQQQQAQAAQAAAQQQLTPQQQQAQAAAQQQASEQLIQHLRAAAQNPAGGAPQGGGSDNQPKRRRVVLPPSGNP
jgi:hypothetical protein